MQEKAFPRHGYPIHSGGRAVGSVTSGTFSPILDRGVGMGYVEIGLSEPWTQIEIMIRDRALPATVTTLPFVKNSAF
jgi:aminomethyltransferase